MHQQPQQSLRLQQVGPQIADVFYALGHVADGETSRRHLSAFYFLPGAGGGDRGTWSCTNSVSSGGMFDMLQLVGEVGKKRLLSMQERWYLSLRKVSIPSLDDKLKLVGRSG